MGGQVLCGLACVARCRDAFRVDVPQALVVASTWRSQFSAWAVRLWDLACVAVVAHLCSCWSAFLSHMVCKHSYCGRGVADAHEHVWLSCETRSVIQLMCRPRSLSVGDREEGPLFPPFYLQPAEQVDVLTLVCYCRRSLASQPRKTLALAAESSDQLPGGGTWKGLALTCGASAGLIRAGYFDPRVEQCMDREIHAVTSSAFTITCVCVVRGH